MPTILPIQEVAYTFPTTTISAVNKLFIQISYTEFHYLNPDDLSYSGYNLKIISIPISKINCTVEQNINSDGNELSCSIIIKNGDVTVLSLNNNIYCTDSSSVFTITDFNNINDSIYSISLV